MRQEPKERITVSVAAPLRKQVVDAAREAGQTLSVWVERALKSFMKNKG